MAVVDRRRKEYLASDIRTAMLKAEDKTGRPISQGELGGWMGMSQQGVANALAGGATPVTHVKFMSAIREIVKHRLMEDKRMTEEAGE